MDALSWSVGLLVPMADMSTTYDRLFPSQVVFFVALVIILNLGIVTLAYSFFWKMPFEPVLHSERILFERVISVEADTSARSTGDSLYDALFVGSGIERMAYGDPAGASLDPAGEALRSSGLTGRLLDNLFDYLLLLCHRFGFLVMMLAWAGFLLGAMLVHALIVRQRKRHAFGDTPILLNLWARSTLAYAFPLSFLVWTLPFALHPAVLLGSMAICAGGVMIWSLSMPKIA